VGVLNIYDIMLAQNVPTYIATRKRVLKVTLQVATSGAESVTALLDSEMSRGVADMQTDRRSTLGFIPARLHCSCFYIFYPRDDMLVRVLAMACVCLSQVGVLSKWMDGSSWFLACRLLSTYPTLCFKQIQVPTKMGSFFWNFVPNSGLTENFATAC